MSLLQPLSSPHQTGFFVFSGFHFLMLPVLFSSHHSLFAYQPPAFSCLQNHSLVPAAFHLLPSIALSKMLCFPEVLSTALRSSKENPGNCFLFPSGSSTAAKPGFSHFPYCVIAALHH